MIKKYVLIALVVFPLMAVSNAYGFEWFGASWPENGCGYWVNPRNSSGMSEAAVIESINGAADAWSIVGASFNHCYQGTTTRATTATNGYNDIFFSDETMRSAIAATYIRRQGSTYLEYDIKFFEGRFTFFGQGDTCFGSGRFYLWYIAMHELGHGLGLGHPPGITQAIMYASARSCDGRTELHQDDIDGVTYIYGAGDPPGCF